MDHTEKQTTRLLYYTRCITVPWVSFWRWGFRSNTIQVKPFITLSHVIMLGHHIWQAWRTCCFWSIWYPVINIREFFCPITCSQVYSSSSYTTKKTNDSDLKLWLIWKHGKFAYLFKASYLTYVALLECGNMHRSPLLNTSPSFTPQSDLLYNMHCTVVGGSFWNHP